MSWQIGSTSVHCEHLLHVGLVDIAVLFKEFQKAKWNVDGDTDIFVPQS